jgi:hypothetical protein
VVAKQLNTNRRTAQPFHSCNDQQHREHHGLGQEPVLTCWKPVAFQGVREVQ